MNRANSVALLVLASCLVVLGLAEADALSLHNSSDRIDTDRTGTRMGGIGDTAASCGALTLDHEATTTWAGWWLGVYQAYEAQLVLDVQWSYADCASEGSATFVSELSVECWGLRSREACKSPAGLTFERQLAREQSKARTFDP